MKYVQHDRGKWRVRITLPEELRATTQFELVAGARHFDQNNRTRLLVALRTSFALGEAHWIEATTEE